MLRKLLILTLLVSACTTTYAQKKNKKDKKQEAAAEKVDYKTEGSALPKILLVTKDGEHVTNENLVGESNLIVMLFNPTCDHCVEATVNIEKNIDKFEKTKIILMAAPVVYRHLTYFNNVTRYAKYPKLVVGVDSAGFIDKTFTYHTLPQINIYNKDRVLEKIITGESSFSALEPYVD